MRLIDDDDDDADDDSEIAVHVLRASEYVAGLGQDSPVEESRVSAQGGRPHEGQRSAHG